ncbi:VanZ family protein [Proteiniphilum sp. UBA5384]|uniref:VanZ family protein n=1 Tax=Proteiniphilum sp. UBA5384 TaxID=1947279 RepID=UPI0025E230DE|nr:VanZ family protein [Proteiniphilum sp. UBA5384]
MKILLRYTLLPLLTGLIIFIVTCLVTPSQLPVMPEGIAWDKVVHFSMFFFLSAVSLVDYYRMHKGKPSMCRWLFWGFLIPVIYGGIIELLQKYFFASRSAEWGDWIADMLGSITATFIVIIFLKKHRYSKKNIPL